MKSTQSIIPLFFLLSIYVFRLNGQPNNTTGPASNNLGAIQNAEIPVDKFTGTANVNIPIYTVQSRGTSIPISLSYNTSGIKVKQLGTEVGLGWNLNVGGIITRDVRGNPDEYMTWFWDPSTECESVNLDPSYYVKKFPESYCHDFYQSKKKLYAIKGRVYNASGLINEYVNYDEKLRNDKEADIFYLNVGAYSVKFILQKDDKIELLSPTDVKIEYFHDYREAQYERSGYFETFVRHEGYNSPLEIARFVVTTPDGTKYFFDAVERQMTFSNRSDFSNNIDIWGQETNVNEYNSSWKLTEIRNVHGDLLYTFQYAKEIIQPLFDWRFDIINKPNSSQERIGYYNNQLIFTRRLEKVITENQEIDFQYRLREDMYYSPETDRGFNTYIESYRAKLLEAIQIHPNGVPDFYQKFSFNYHTTNVVKNDFGFKRHFLDGIKLIGKRDGEEKELNLFSFEYKNGVLSHPLNSNEDYWGYNTDPNKSYDLSYNEKKAYIYYDDIGFQNRYKRISTLFPIQGSGSLGTVIGETGQPEEAYMDAGLLNKITNASGLIQDILYEAHEFIDPNVFNYEFTPADICNKTPSYNDNCSNPTVYNFQIPSGESKRLVLNKVLHNNSLNWDKRLCIGSADINTYDCDQILGNNSAVTLYVPNDWSGKPCLKKEVSGVIFIEAGFGQTTFEVYSSTFSKTYTINGYGRQTFEFEVPLNANDVSVSMVSQATNLKGIIDINFSILPKSTFNVICKKNGNIIVDEVINNDISGFDLTEGNYEVSVVNNNVYNAPVDQMAKVNLQILKAKDLDYSHLYKGGGLRVKSVTTNDGQNVITKSYNYTNEKGQCSGRLLNMPEFYNATKLSPVGGIENFYSSTANLIKYGLETPTNVAYTEVTEIISGKGKTVSRFNLDNNPLIFANAASDNGITYNLPTLSGNQSQFILGAEYYFPLINGGSRKGQLISETAYNTSNQIVGYSSYSLVNKIYKRVVNSWNFKRQNGSNVVDNTCNYSYYAFDDRMLSSTSTSYRYDENGTQSSSTGSTVYEYRTGGITLPWKVTNSSGGITTITETTVAADQPQTYSYFINKHQLYVPVETKTYRNNIQIAGEKIEFAQFGGKYYPSVTKKWFYDEYIPVSEVLSYNAKGQPTEVKDLFTNRNTTYVYETNFEGVQSSTSNGRTITMEYYPDYLLKKKTTSADGLTLNYEYDPLGILKKTTEPTTTGMTSIHEYAVGNGSVITEKLTQLGRIFPDKVSTYAAGGQMLSEAAGDGLTTTAYNFNQSQQTTESTYAKSKSTETIEPSLNPSWKKTSLSNWPGIWTTYSTYVGGSEKVKVIDPDGRFTETVTDGLGRTVSKGKGGVNAGYAYDEYGRLLTITQPNGQQWVHTYTKELFGSGNPQEKVIKEMVTAPTGEVTVSYTNYRGLVKRSIDAKGNIFDYLYDNLDLLETVNLNSMPWKSFTYYPSGSINVDKVQHSTYKMLGGSGGNVTESSNYDSKGRLVSQGVISEFGSIGTEYFYDQSNFLYQTTTTTTGSIGSNKVDISYTKNDEMYRVGSERIRFNNGSWMPLAEYSYNAQKKVSAKTVGGTLQTIDYYYNGADWLSAINEINDCKIISEPHLKDGPIQVDGYVVISFDPEFSGKKNGVNFEFHQQGKQNNDLKYDYTKHAGWGPDKSSPPTKNPNPFTISWTGNPIDAVWKLQINTAIRDSMLANGGSFTSSDSISLNNFLDGILIILRKRPCETGTNDAFAEEIVYDRRLAPESEAPGHKPLYGGLISGTRWRVGNRSVIPQYAYTYDGKGWLSGSYYKEYSQLAPAPPIPPNYDYFIKKGVYNELVGYADVIGNIGTITRNGYIGNNQYDQVDHIQMTYTGNKLNTVSESAMSAKGWQNYGGNSSQIINYDAANNTGSYSPKGIRNNAIQYNILDLPSRIEVTGKGTYEAVYDASGRLWKYTITPEPGQGQAITRRFGGGFESLNGTVIAYNHAHGRHVLENGNWVGEYVIQDHVGNVRVTVKDINGDGSIDLTGNMPEIWQEKHFYPFGMPMEGEYNNQLSGWINRQQDHSLECRDGFNSMEYIDALEMDMYFTTFRSQDPGIGRWLQVDPKATADPALAVYASMGNNPVSQVDPDGDIWQVLVGAAIGGVMYSIQAGDNWTWEGFGFSVGMGAIGGAISFGIGSFVSQAGLSTGGQLLLGAFMHGVSQGAMSAVQGGDFLTGAATGAFSSLAGAVLSAAGANTNDITRAAITIAGGGAVGGITESAMGGNFWNGFKTGLIVAGLNHAAHETYQSLRKILIEVTDEIVGSTNLRGYPNNSGDYEVPTYKMTVTGKDMYGDTYTDNYEVVRFGIKDVGKGAMVVGMNPGKYVVRAYNAKAIGGLGGFQISGKYFIHIGSTGKTSNFDGNNGCIAILRNSNFNTSYSSFYVSIFNFSGGTNIFQISKSGVINVNINNASKPKLLKL